MAKNEADYEWAREEIRYLHNPEGYEPCDCHWCEEATMSEAERIARLFHETYERLAPEYEYQTRARSAKPWGQLPDDNRRLMIATAEVVLGDVARQLERARGARHENHGTHVERCPKHPMSHLARQLAEALEEISECHLWLGYHCATDGCKWCKEADDDE